MTIQPMGDQARNFALQSATSRLRNTMQTLTQELASGEVSEIGQRVGGNTQALNDLETRLRMTEAFRQTTASAATVADVMLNILGDLQQGAVRIGVSFLMDAGSTDTSVLDLRSAEANSGLQTAISRLNTQFGGQHLFSGIAVDRPPLPPANLILDQLETMTAGMPDPAQVADTVSAWFDAPAGAGGFLDTAYFGTVGIARPAQISETQQVQMDIDAATLPVRETLKGLAVAALTSRALPDLDDKAKLQLMRTGADVLLRNDTALLGEIGRLGLTAERLARARVGQDAQLATMTIARNQIREADPYATSAALTEVTTQLETIYTVTARLQQLSLVDYLR